LNIVREHINEKFSEESDPIQDMGIGIIHKIEKWIGMINRISNNNQCDGIRNYTINNDGTIDCQGFTALPDNCGNFPEYINFNKIDGEFIICNCNMTTLRGCPKIVTGDFDCRFNKLTSLEYCPEIIGKKFMCGGNKKRFTREYVQKYCKIAKDKIRTT